MAFRQIFLSLKKSKLLLLLLAVFFVKQLFMVAVFPMFQGPDEPVHYATIQDAANPISQARYKELLREKGNNIPKYSQEATNTYNLVESEKIFFHPDSTQIFASGVNGSNEKEIKNNHLEKTRGKNLVSSFPGYYLIPTLIEKTLSGNDIFTRFFGVRIFSAILGLLIILLSYLSVRKIGFNEKISLLFSSIIAFQPMFSQTSAIINYDIMLIFSFSLFIYGAIWSLKDNINWKNTFVVIFAISIGMLTKAPAVVLSLAFYILIAYFIKKRFEIDNKKFFIYFGIATIFTAILLILLYPSNYFNLTISQLRDSKFDSIFQSISKYISVTKDRWSWSELSYWGNFGWLDAGISSWIVSLAHWVEIAGITGVIAYFLFPKKIPEFLPNRKFVIFLIGIFLALEFAVRLADWSYFDTHKEIAIGTPGRYFLPVIFAQFSLIIIGLGMLVRKYLIWKNIIKVLALSMIMLWVYSVLIVIIPRYYL